jgi:hypothetical protein
MCENNVNLKTVNGLITGAELSGNVNLKLNSDSRIDPNTLLACEKVAHSVLARLLAEVVSEINALADAGKLDTAPKGDD